jgi:hypothetical protein
MTMMNPTQLTDVALTEELGRLAARERAATTALIVHLAEFDARRLYEGAGYSSLFQYCRAVLHLSGGRDLQPDPDGTSGLPLSGDRGHARGRPAQSHHGAIARSSSDG